MGWTGNHNLPVAGAQDGTPPPSRQQDTGSPPRRAFVPAETPAELLSRAQSAGTIRVIVGYDTSTRFQPEGVLSVAEAQAQRTAVAQGRQALLQVVAPSQAQVMAGSNNWSIPYVALQVDAAGLQALQASPQVVSIREDGLNYQLNNSDSLDNMNVPEAWSNGYDGSGFAVAILDIGVQTSHDHFAGRVADEYCSSLNLISFTYHFVSLCPGGVDQTFGVGASDPADCVLAVSALLPFEDCDHGTHVAGIATGNAPASDDGVARDADIIGVQVFTLIQCFDVNAYCDDATDHSVGAFDSNIIDGLNYVYSVRNLYNVASVNLSLGGGGYTSQSSCDAHNPSMKAAIDQLRSANIATLIASGNDFYGIAIGYPACISSAIAVGSTSDIGEFDFGMPLPGKISSFTNANFMLDLLAPGYGISSSVPDTTLPYSQTDTKNGTSMATPQVAGAWAVVREALPYATVSQILTAFQQTGTPVVDNIRADGLGCIGGCSGRTYKLINVDAAITALQPTTPTLTAPLAIVMTSDTTPTLTWTALRANEYDVRLDTVNPPVALVGVTSPSYTPAQPLQAAVYYWQVKGYNTLGGESEWSDIRSFSVDVPAPRNYFVTSVATLTWSRITWATGYVVQYANNSSFTGALTSGTLLASTLSFDTVGLADGTYYWRVRALNGALPPGNWSATESFVIDVP